MNNKYITNLGVIDEKDGWISLDKSSDDYFCYGEDGVNSIVSTGDRKVELISFRDKTLAYVKSSMGYPAYYPLMNVERPNGIKAVLMDLDGTTVKSEEFWMWIIEKTIQSLLDDSTFKFTDTDIPHVSGHSVSEHLKYCIEKYCPTKSLEEARSLYFKHTNYEMQEIMAGRGKKDAFTPNSGIKEFLMALKEKGIKIGLVTSGLYEKAYPEILSAFNTLDMNKPEEFYDCIITAGQQLKRGSIGTLGELEAKPHPWLYSETGRVGLGIDHTDRNMVIGIEDSGAGVCALRLAGYYTIGIAGGNIIESGTLGMCNSYFESFSEILKFIEECSI